MPAQPRTKQRPFKDYIDPAAVAELSGWLARVEPDFPASAFIADATDGLLDLELKARVQHVAKSLHRHIASEFPTAAAHIVAALPPALTTTDAVTGGGFMVWCLSQYVQDFGLDHFDAAFAAMKELTARFSCEFAVRPFLVRYPKRSMTVLQRWTTDANPHVRRLVSEGTRPRLPWGEQLRASIADPEPTIALLERLKDDPELYVRRSVANHINDIAKDHPKRAVALCESWLVGASKERAWIVRHALRSLIKAGDAGALRVLGFGTPEVTGLTFAATPAEVAIGGDAELEVRLVCEKAADQRLVIDYAVHFQKVRGTSPKVFKWSTRTLAAGAALHLSKRHSFKDVSIRSHRAGPHRIVLLINGEALAECVVELRSAADAPIG